MERKWIPRHLSWLSLVMFFITHTFNWLPQLYQGALLGFGLLGIVIWVFSVGTKAPPRM